MANLENMREIPAETQKWLDKVTQAVTAFPTYDALIEANYTPTIYPDSRRKRILRRMLKAEGIKVYPYNVD